MLATTLVGVISQTLCPTLDKTGRVAALEIMAKTDAIAAMIREDKTFQINSSITTGKEHGMFSLDQHLAMLCKNKFITKETALSKCKDEGEFLRFWQSR